MRNKIFTKIIITTLLVTFLTFNVGRVTRVSAIATSAAIATTALVGTGLVFLGYLALTNANVQVPSYDTSDMQNYLRDIGSNVVSYTSGLAIYNDIFDQLLSAIPFEDVNIMYSPLTLENLYNDFKDIEIIQRICGFSTVYDRPLANFDFSNYTLSIPQTVYSRNTYTLDYVYSNYDVVTPSGPRAAIISGYTYFPFYTNINYPVRNLLKTNGYYYPQIFNGSTWQTVDTVDALYPTYVHGSTSLYRYLRPSNINSWIWMDSVGVTYIYNALMPVFIDSDIYVESTGETIHHLEDTEVEVISPTYNYGSNDDEDPQGPIVPYVFQPPVPSGGNLGGSGWGLNLMDLFEKMIEIGGTGMGISTIADLINLFKNSLQGTDEYNNYYYLDLSDDDTYRYYTNVYNDYDNPIYNISIISQEYAIPVDLNTISNYTHNRYLEQIKESAIAGSSMLRDFAVFWHDVDPEVTYIMLGCCILVLIGAFTGKLGHS